MQPTMIVLRVAVCLACVVPFALASDPELQEYCLQPGDVISINILEHPEFSGRHKIRPDGRINYPVIGEIEVATLTTAQLVKILEGKFSSYVNNPVVSVSVDAYYFNTVLVGGDVPKPGPYEIYGPIHVLRIVVMAGGPPTSTKGTVNILKPSGAKMKVKMRDLFTEQSLTDTDRYLVYPGTVIFVDSGSWIDWDGIQKMITTILSFIGLLAVIGRGIGWLRGMKRGAEATSVT